MKFAAILTSFVLCGLVQADSPTVVGQATATRSTTTIYNLKTTDPKLTLSQYGKVNNAKQEFHADFIIDNFDVSGRDNSWNGCWFGFSLSPNKTTGSAGVRDLIACRVNDITASNTTEPIVCWDGIINSNGLPINDTINNVVTTQSKSSWRVVNNKLKISAHFNRLYTTNDTASDV
jgi:hypothetical protein